MYTLTAVLIIYFLGIGLGALAIVAAFQVKKELINVKREELKKKYYAVK